MHNHITEIKNALKKEHNSIPANYACWIIEKFDFVDENERTCISDIHNAPKYKVETNFKMNLILKIDDR